MNKLPSTLSSDATEVLAEALPGDDPSSSDRERIERRLRARLGAAVFAGGGASKAAVASKASVTLAATSTAVGVGGGLAAKVILAVVVASASVGTTAFVRHRSASQRAAAVARVDQRPVSVAAPALPTPPAVAPTAEPAADLLAVEVALMGRIRAALREDRATDALTLLDQHARSFPKGAFSEEGLLARITAFCALGRTTEARRLVAQFRRELPTSAYRAQVDASCGGTREPE